MKISKIFISVLVASLLLTLNAPSGRFNNLSSAHASRQLPLADFSDESTVSVKSEHLTGTLPNGLPVVVRLDASLTGEDPTSLSGMGRHFASTGAHNYWSATGTISGAIVTISGIVTDTNVPYLIGSPVEVVANSTTEQVTMNFGPLAGGPFAGVILVFTGIGKLEITGGD